MSGDKAVRQHQDVSELLQTGEPLVLAVDQIPFEVESRGVKNTFCLLVPLTTETGLDVKRDQFRNRERVWWMLRPDIEAGHIQVGTVWSGSVERSRAYGNPEKEKDHYQVRRSEIRPGSRHLVEVLNLKVTHPDLNELLSPEGIPWPYTPMSRVIIRGGLSVVGPFESRYDHSTRRLQLQSIDPREPRVYRLSRADFEARTEVRDYSYRANQWDAKAQEMELELTFVHERELDLLEEIGEQLDGATDRQLVLWALGLMRIPEAGRHLFAEVLDRSEELKSRVESSEFPERFERFTKFCQDRARVVELGGEVARTVASRDGFRELVEKHIETLTSEHVNRAIDKRSHEIEESTASAETSLRELEARIADLDGEYKRRLEGWEQEFQRLHGERLQEMEDRGATLERQEREMRERLQGMVNTFRDEAKTFGDQLLAQLPLLRRLGALNVGEGTPAANQLPSTDPLKLKLPSFLGEAKTSNNLTEREFLEQLQRVVAQHGFVFEEDDLVNFHVLVKTGLWTVLAGTSGVGKSSLPRFYAEALGNADEYLLVPVRPDWLDDRDVLGAFNALSSRYEPAPSGLVDRLIAAYEDGKAGRGGLYIICLDEMNLARVEHYFAQFLSVLEQPPEARTINLFARGMLDPEDPYSPYRTLNLGPNIRLVGTVNVDETTHFFSPKLVDRVSIATLERPDLRRGLDHGEGRRPADVEPILLDVFLSWVKEPDRQGEPVDLILQADDILKRSRLSLGFRVRDRMLRYVSSARSLLGEDRAVDLAFLQNVIPCLRPVAPRYIELLRDLQGLLPEARFQRTARMLKNLEEDPESDIFQLL